jgi:hypothetical protein
MTQDIKIVQGFRGEYPYTLSFNGIDIDISSNTTVYFNFTNGIKRYSIHCNQGPKPNEVIIPFTTQTSEFGEFDGEFVVQTSTSKSIYPIETPILVKIRKCI